MTNDTFRPFDGEFDRDAALAVLRDATNGADDGEIFVERAHAETLIFDDRRLRGSSYTASQGFGLRAVAGEVTGYAHSTELTLPTLRRAAETVRLAVGNGGRTLALPLEGAVTPLYMDLDPAEGIDIATRIELLREIDAYARALDPTWCRPVCRCRPACNRWRFCAPKAVWSPTSARWRD